MTNYAFLEASNYLGRGNSALQTSSLKLFEKETAELLGAAISQMKTHISDALVSLPIFSAFLTVLRFPMMSPEELSKAVIFHAQQYVPLPLSDVVLDWLKVGEFEDEQGNKQQHVLLISVPQEHIQKYQRIFKTAGLNLRVLEIESLSVARALVGNDPTPTVIIDIGSRSTNISFIDKGKLRLNSQSDYAGASLTEAIATSLNINAQRAEELKRQKGIIGTGADYELSTIMLPFLDVIINEVKKARANYETQFLGTPKIERAIITGGTANLKGILKYMQRELEMPVVKAAPFTRFEYDPSLEELVPELNPVMSVALGLGLREYS